MAWHITPFFSPFLEAFENDIPMTDAKEGDNFGNFRDCLSTSVIEKLTQSTGKPLRKTKSKGRRNSIKQSTEGDHNDNDENDPAELSDFMEVAIPLLPHVMRFC